MNAEAPKSPFAALLILRVETVRIEINGATLDIELREQPMGIVQDIIKNATDKNQTQNEMMKRLMAVSFFIDGEALGDERADKMSLSTFLKLKPASDKMMLAYGLQPDEEEKPDEKKDLSEADGSPELFDPNSS
jgi:hypothetical protein